MPTTAAIRQKKVYKRIKILNTDWTNVEDARSEGSSRVTCFDDVNKPIYQRIRDNLRTELMSNKQQK
jgi:hypothetical protein